MGCSPPARVLLVEDLRQQRLPARTLAAVLRQAGLAACIASFSAGDDPATLMTLAQREQPHLVVLSILFDHLLAEHLTLAQVLREAGLPAHVTLVGPLPTAAYAALLAAAPALDSVLCGDPEIGIVPLAQALARGAPWDDVPGLAHRGPPIRINPPPHPLTDLDALPFPARDDGIAIRNGVGFATVAASRGCYHACTFCLPCAVYRQGSGPAYRPRSVPNLLDELEALYHQGARLFLFDDEQFLPPRPARAQRADELEMGLQQRGLEIAFTIKCRPDDIDESFFRQLQAMGLIRVYLGVEAGNQLSLDRLGKRLTPVCNAEALALLDKLGIVADFRCLLWHPWSTRSSIQEDIEFLQQMAPRISTPLTFREVICYAGTPMAEMLVAEGRGQSGGWLQPYRIDDPVAELLRRLARLVFGARDAAGGLTERFSEAWFDALLARRFGHSAHARRNRTPRALVDRLNRASLGVWQEMISFTTDEDCYDVRQVNDRAVGWATRVRELDQEALSDLAALGAPFVRN